MHSIIASSEGGSRFSLSPGTARNLLTEKARKKEKAREKKKKTKKAEKKLRKEEEKLKKEGEKLRKEETKASMAAAAKEEEKLRKKGEKLKKKEEKLRKEKTKASMAAAAKEEEKLRKKEEKLKKKEEKLRKEETKASMAAAAKDAELAMISAINARTAAKRLHNERVAKEQKLRAKFILDEKLRSRLEDEGIMLKTIAGDGNCLYKSTSDQLHGDGGNSHKHEILRKDAVKWMEDNKEDLLHFFPAGSTRKQKKKLNEHLEQVKSA